jgi:hypothetical protein
VAAWDLVESPDTAKLIANLRALGCPEQTIRELVTFRICRDYRNRLLASRADLMASWDFTRNRSARDARDSLRQESELRSAMDSELERLLGAPAAQLKDGILGWSGPGGVNEFLPLAKQGQVRELNQRYQSLMEDAREGLLPWESDPAVDARLKELDRQKQAELARLLSPQELAALNLRDSPASQYARNHLPEAKSEAEFEKMVQAVETVGIVEPQMDPMVRFGLAPSADTSADQRSFAEQQAQLEGLLRQVLGDPRAAEQQQEEQARQAEQAERERARGEQQERARMLSLADSVGVSAEDANRFLERLKELQPVMDKTFSDLEKTLAANPNKSAFMEKAVQGELERIAVEMLGEKGRALVRKMAGGQAGP